MLIRKKSYVVVENHIIRSEFLERDVKVDCYLPSKEYGADQMSLVLINDGQDLGTMKFEDILQNLYDHNEITPLLCVGLHCSADRKNEYGTAKYLDYKGRGAKAALYNRFVFEEVMPFIRKTFHIKSFRDKSYAGFP